MIRSLLLALLAVSLGGTASAQDASFVLAEPSPALGVSHVLETEGVVRDLVAALPEGTVVQPVQVQRDGLRVQDAVLIGLAGATATTLVFSAAGNWDSPTPLVLMPFITSGTIYGTGQALGYDGDALATIGAASATALAGIAIMATSPNTDAWISEQVLLGAMVYAFGTPIAAFSAYALTLPPPTGVDGNPIPTVGLRVGL